MLDTNRRCHEILLLWLRWNEEQQRLTETLFEQREQPEKLEALLDRVDELRREAVANSQQLLKV